MTNPSDTQSLILSRAATRPGNLALPLPEGLVGAAAKMVVGKMIARGWLEEVEANLQRGEPMWRETGDGHGTTLIATEAGLEAIGIEPVVASAVASVRKARPNPEPGQMPDDTDTAKPVDLPPQPVFAYTIKSIMPPCGEASRICRLPVATFSRSFLSEGEGANPMRNGPVNILRPLEASIAPPRFDSRIPRLAVQPRCRDTGDSETNARPLSQARNAENRRPCIARCSLTAVDPS